MSEATIKPTIEKLESLFTTFNKRFYNGELEKAVITVSPDEGRNAYGWCTTYKAWKNQQDNEKGYYEINICAEHLSRNFNELCSTLLHEMVHLWNLQTEIQDTSRGGVLTIIKSSRKLLNNMDYILNKYLSTDGLKQPLMKKVNSSLNR